MTTNDTPQSNTTPKEATMTTNTDPIIVSMNAPDSVNAPRVVAADRSTFATVLALALLHVDQRPELDDADRDAVRSLCGDLARASNVPDPAAAGAAGIADDYDACPRCGTTDTGRFAAGLDESGHEDGPVLCDDCVAGFTRVQDPPDADTDPRPVESPEHHDADEGDSPAGWRRPESNVLFDAMLPDGWALRGFRDGTFDTRDTRGNALSPGCDTPGEAIAWAWEQVVAQAAYARPALPEHRVTDERA